MVDRPHHKDLLMGLFDPNSKKPVYDPVQATELLDELRRVIPWGGLKWSQKTWWIYHPIFTCVYQDFLKPLNS